MAMYYLHKCAKLCVRPSICRTGVGYGIAAIIYKRSLCAAGFMAPFTIRPFAIPVVIIVWSYYQSYQVAFAWAFVVCQW